MPQIPKYYKVSDIFKDKDIMVIDHT